MCAGKFVFFLYSILCAACVVGSSRVPASHRIKDPYFTITKVPPVGSNGNGEGYLATASTNCQILILPMDWCAKFKALGHPCTMLAGSLPVVMWHGKQLLFCKPYHDK